MNQNLQDRLHDFSGDVLVENLTIKSFNEAATHIEQDLLAIIGEDETGEDLNPNDMDDELVRLFRNKRNDLRAELRTAITAYCKGETK